VTDRIKISEKNLKRLVRTNINFLDRAIFLPVSRKRKKDSKGEFQYKDSNGFVLNYKEKLGPPTLFDQKVLYTLLFLAQRQHFSKQFLNPNLIDVKAPSRFLRVMNYTKAYSVRAHGIRNLQESLERLRDIGCQFDAFWENRKVVQYDIKSILNEVVYDDKKLVAVELNKSFVEEASAPYSRLLDLDKILRFSSGISFRCYEILCKMEPRFTTVGHWEIGLKKFYYKIGLGEMLKSPAFRSNSRGLLTKALSLVMEELQKEGFHKISWSYKEGRNGTVVRFVNTNFCDISQFLANHEHKRIIQDVLNAYLEELAETLSADENYVTWSYKKSSDILISLGKQQLGILQDKDFKGFAQSLKIVIQNAKQELEEVHKVFIETTFTTPLTIHIKVVSN